VRGRALLLVGVLTVCGAVSAGCTSDEEPALTAETASRADGVRQEPPRAPRLQHARCPADVANCRTGSGRIIYVERVDPDGDGDAHFVLASRESVTSPGVSVIDVKRSLRPRPLPGPGDLLSAAGPVYTGSYGQRQIEATELYVARGR
jgi:hypothetical protein